MVRNKGWYVLYVKSRHEGKVYRLLKEQGIEAFLPMTTVIRKWSDRKKKLKVPLFSSYVFVKIKTSMDFHLACNVAGACAFIKFGVEYAKVSDKEMNWIRILLNTEGVEGFKVIDNEPTVGEKHKIGHGPLQGLDFEVTRVNSKSVTMVRLDSIKQNIAVTIPKQLLYKHPLTA